MTTYTTTASSAAPKKLHRIDFHSKRTGAQVFLLIRATDAFELMYALDGILFGQEQEYSLDGIRILDGLDGGQGF